MQTLVNVKSLRKYLEQMTNEQYQKLPILTDIPTRSEAIKSLYELETAGIKWIK